MVAVGYIAELRAMRDLARWWRGVAAQVLLRPGALTWLCGGLVLILRC